MIREGEESQEDSLKITSDENFPKYWIWILISHVLDSKYTCDFEFRKFLNSQTWQNGLNNQNHAWAMKIWPKIEKMNLTSYERISILDHEETNLILLRDVFHEIRLKISFYNPRWKVCLMGFDERKRLKFSEKNALCFENAVRSLSFFTLKSFHTSQISMRWKILKTRTKSSLLSKISSKLSLLVSPLSLQI